MPELNYEQLEESLRRAHKKSLGRFLIFLGFVLVLWIATYVVTKGQFSFFTKKIAVTDTLVIDQSAALQSKDSTIADQQKLISFLKDSINRLTKPIPPAELAKVPSKKIDSTSIVLQTKIDEKIREQKKRDAILKEKILIYNRDFPNQMNQMQQPKKQ